MEYNGRRIASESKQTVRGGPKPAKVGLHRRLVPYRNANVFKFQNFVNVDWLVILIREHTRKYVDL